MEIVRGSALDASDASALAHLINRTCAHKRNFSPIDSTTLMGVWTRDASLANRGLFLIKDETGALLGATHAVFDEDTGRGYLPFLLAIDGLERVVWPLLLAASEEYLYDSTTIHIGSPYTPLYCAVEGRFQPLWGTTECMEPEQNDTALLAFLRSSGFRHRYTHTTLTRNLSDLEIFTTPETDQALEILRGKQCWDNDLSWYGKTAQEDFGLQRDDLSVLLIRRERRVIGHVAWYPMRASGKVAISDLAVGRRWRGRGLGKLLLHHALGELHRLGYSEVELCTTPKLSPAAMAIYDRVGFTTSAVWHEMVKLP